MTTQFTVPVDPETLEQTRRFNAECERQAASRPPVHEVPVEQTRRRNREGGAGGPTPVFLPNARTISVPGRAGAIPVRTLAPDGTPTGVYLHIHGGAGIFGGADLQDPLLWEMVEATGMCVVSVDYRLAPEQPYPAAQDDCADVACWLATEGAAALGAPRRLTMGGESSGAQLAATTLVRLRDRHGISGAFRAANLMYGCYDMSLTPSVRLSGATLGLSLETRQWFHDQTYPGRDREARRCSDISPLFANLAGMPPAVFTVGTRDPLLDDTLFMEARWRAAGNPARLLVWPEAAHGFNLSSLAMAEAANRETYSFLRAALTN